MEKDISIIELANVLGIDKSTVYRKLNKSGENFTVKDVEKISKALSLTYDDINDIFFTNIVAWYATSYRLVEVKSNEREKVKCPKCNVEVIDGNFCEHCGAKLKQVCDCWVLKKKYNCGFDECKGYKLLIDSIKGKEFSWCFQI